MNLSDFSYELPERLIAQYPLTKREDAKLMIINRASKTIVHDVFKNLPKYLPSQVTILLNNSKVIHARLLGEKESTGAKIEVFLLNPTIDEYHYEVLMKPMKRLKNGDTIHFLKSRVRAEVVDREKRIVRFNQKNLKAFLEKHGHIPLPPYIKRQDEKIDRTHYQTVYADKAGSVAAPTAGLHFTKSVLNRLKKDKHKIKEATLHINYGTFKPVEVEDITTHKMHTESYRITQATYNSLKKAKDNDSPIMAVGTTSARIIETVAKNKILEGDTNIFIYPGKKIRWVDILLTNFHLPNSTLLMLVYAFGGMDLMKEAYQQAISHNYRFYSYGDAMLIT